MKYFKNTELAELHHVSEKSIRNWIQAAQQGKLDLELHEKNNRLYIANTFKNSSLIEQLVQKGKKYKNTRGQRTIHPNENLYRTYTPRQILDIISNLTIHHEIPRQYNYLDGGAKYWDQFSKRLIAEEESNIITDTLKLLNLTAGHVDESTGTQKKVNIVDLGPGNGFPIRSELERFLKEGRLNRYIAVDISQEMLDITEKNIKAWFGDAIKFEGYIRDFSYERFDDLLLNSNDTEVPINLVYLLGSTLNNFREPGRILQIINDCLRPDDLFFYTSHLDTPKTRRHFDFKPANPNQKLFLVRVLFDYLNIDDDLYDVEESFDEENRERYCSIRPKMDLYVEIKLSNISEYVELRKNEPILLWRHVHYSAVDLIDMFDEYNFSLLQAIKSKNQEYFLVISKIETNRG